MAAMMGMTSPSTIAHHALAFSDAVTPDLGL